MEIRKGVEHLAYFLFDHNLKFRSKVCISHTQNPKKSNKHSPSEGHLAMARAHGHGHDEKPCLLAMAIGHGHGQGPWPWPWPWPRLAVATAMAMAKGLTNPDQTSLIFNLLVFQFYLVVYSF